MKINLDILTKILIGVFVITLPVYKNTYFLIVLIIIIVLLGFLMNIRNRSNDLLNSFNSPIILIFGITVLYWIFNLIFIAKIPFNVYTELGFWREDFKQFLAYLPIFIPLLFVGRNVNWNKLIDWMVHFSVLICLLSIIQFFSEYVIPGVDGRDQLVLFGNFLGKSIIGGHLSANPFAVFSIFGGIYFFIEFIASMKEKINYVHLVEFSVILIALLLSFSRSGMIGFVLCFLVCILILTKQGYFFNPQTQKLVKSLLLVMLVIIIGMFTFVPQWKYKIYELVNLQGGNITSRVELWGEAINEFSRSPIFGIGISRFNDKDVTYTNVFPFITIAADGKLVFNSAHAHNSYLHTLVETGLVGFGLLILFWYLVLKSFTNYLNKDDDFKTIRVASFCSIIGLLVASLFEHDLAAPSIIFLYSFLIGLNIVSIIKSDG